MSDHFTREAQLTREEFLRQLPGAVGDLKYRADGNSIVINGNANKLIRINLTDLGIEEKGSLDLPMQRVEFSFENMSDTEIDEFMANWDEHKLRMGG